MQKVNLSGVDLNLLPPLHALLLRRNVTRAASDVGMSQPAMSRALARLRDLLGDQLLVRGNKGLIRTPRGEALLPIVADALNNLVGVFEPPIFDPTTIERVIRFAASDVQTILLAPALHEAMRRDAPKIDLRFEPYGRDVVNRIEDGRLDFAFALTSTPLPVGATSFKLFDDRYALVMRKGHPMAKHKWTLKDYARVDHIGVSLIDDGISDLDAMLAAENITRRMALITPHFIAALAAVSASNAVTTISRAFAARFADQFALQLRDPPFQNMAMTTTLVTSSIRARDPMMMWMVQKVRQASEAAYRAFQA